MQRILVHWHCRCAAPMAPPTPRRTTILRDSPFDGIGDLLEQVAAPPEDSLLPLGSFGAVVTGGAAGVGYAADEFLRRGHKVVIYDIKDPADAVRALKDKYGADAPHLRRGLRRERHGFRAASSPRLLKTNWARSTTGSTTRR